MAGKFKHSKHHIKSKDLKEIHQFHLKLINSKSNFRKSSDMSLSTFSTIGTGYTSFKRRFSSASQTTTKTELPDIVE